MRIVLHDYWRSSAAYRVRIALALKGVRYDRVAVNLLAGEQSGNTNRSINPQGFVPTLMVDGVPLVQSLAIIDFLDATFPEPPMVSADPFTRAGQLARALVIAADTHPLNNLRVLKRLETQFDADKTVRDAWIAAWVSDGLAALEAMVAGSTGAFLGGEAPDLVDVCLVPQLYSARRFEVPLDAYPRLVAADAAAAALPAFRAAHPDAVKPDD